VLTRDYAQVADWIAQGKYGVGFAQTADRIEELRKEGIPLKAFSLPDAPGRLGGGFSVVALLQSVQHPSAATVFLNWFLTREGQLAFQKPLVYPSLRTDVPRDFVPDYTIAKPGVEYTDTSGEDFIPTRQKLATEVRDLLGR
jgi:ABC-type Fe3+ transport system substrate-binding protein